MECNHFLLSMLYFFGGEFDFVLNHAMKCKEALGWSTTFIKCGLSAFLLLLLEGETLYSGCKKLLEQVTYHAEFDMKDYQNGLLDIYTEDAKDWFWKCICHWKSVVELTEVEKKKYLMRMEKLIKKRVDAIIEGNHTKYYGECTMYIAALGEVKESRGIKDGKN